MKVSRWANLLLNKLQKTCKKFLNTPRKLIKDNRNGNGNRKTIRNLRFGTWNIRTIFKPRALKIIIDEITKYNLQIVALQEMRCFVMAASNIKKQQTFTVDVGMRGTNWELVL